MIEEWQERFPSFCQCAFVYYRRKNHKQRFLFLDKSRDRVKEWRKMDKIWTKKKPMGWQKVMKGTQRSCHHEMRMRLMKRRTLFRLLQMDRPGVSTSVLILPYLFSNPALILSYPFSTSALILSYPFSTSALILSYPISNSVLILTNPFRTSVLILSYPFSNSVPIL